MYICILIALMFYLYFFQIGDEINAYDQRKPDNNDQPIAMLNNDDYQPEPGDDDQPKPVDDVQLELDGDDEPKFDNDDKPKSDGGDDQLSGQDKVDVVDG